MSPRSWPEPVGVDPQRAELPASLRAVLEQELESQPILLLVAGEEAHESGWAGALAARIAAAVAAEGRRIVLADLGLEDPTLHVPASLPNEEGLSDVFLFGASLTTVAKRVAGKGYYLAPAGTYAGDAAELFAHSRWPRLLEGFRDAGATLIAYLPLSTSGTAGLLEQVGRAVALGTRADLPLIQARGAETIFIAATVPPGDGAPPRGEHQDDRIEEPLFVQRPPALRPVRRGIPPLLLILLLLVGAAGLWFTFGERLTTAATRAPAVSTASDPVLAEPRPVETPLPFSVAIESHESLETASERLAELRRQEPEAEFYVTPAPVYGQVWYRVMAGPLADSASAAGLLDRLVEEGLKRDAEEWDVRSTEWAHLLGEFPTRSAAQRRVSELAAGGVPAYVVAIDYTAGAPRYRIYAGAYETLWEAEAMARFLEEAGVTGHTLERRTGKVGA